ncbi:MAG: flagellar basal body-associated protein FliL [Betaproteobacteria bacterium]|nr:flagellar basal body-associated protein FliL [Betaproteobacteria bacterium]
MAKAPEKAPAKEEAAEAAPPKKGKGKLIIIVVVLVLLAGGGAAWFFMAGNGDPKEKKVAAPKPPVYFPIEQFTVNLQPEGEEQYLQVAMTLKVADSKVTEHLKLHDPELRNRFLMILTNKAPSQLNNVEGKRQLANELVQAARRPFVEGQAEQDVLDVHFTAFIIQ